MARRSIIILALTAIAVFLAGTARGQVIVSVSVPTDVCDDTSAVVTFGTRPANNIVVAPTNSTLGHSETVFLPDGVECNGSCSYLSPVTFSDFPASSSIASVQNIKYVRLNMEHSYIGDIYINITCPNGQKADIMRFGGSGTSSCDGTIPSASTGWLAGSNMSEGTFFGQPVDQQNTSQPCNPNAPGNQPGIGWNYCWSNNTTSGYQYASGDGIVYRSGHAHNGRVDSSNVAQHTNFYHPDQSFASLIGCPLNGTWYIEVVDGYSVDNGYIFDWSLTLDPSLVPQQCDVTGYGVVEGPNTQIDDTTFRLTPPEGLEADSTVRYTFRIFNSCGGYVDTVADITFHPAHHSLTDTTVCDLLVWGGDSLVRDTVISFVGSNIFGCDSTSTLLLTVHPTYPLRPYYRFDGDGWAPADSLLAGCASTILHLCDSTGPGPLQRQWRFFAPDTQFASSEQCIDFEWTHGSDSLAAWVSLVATNQYQCADSAGWPVYVFPSPRAEFSWYPEGPSILTPMVQMLNMVQPEPADLLPEHSISYLWEIQAVEGGSFDTTSEYLPFYQWGEASDDMSGDYDVNLVAYWTHYADSLRAGDAPWVPAEVLVARGPFYHTCTDTAHHTITITNEFLQFPNLVTPNGDGINDRWEVMNLLEFGNYPMNELWIYDRTGAPVYHVRNISTPEQFWDPAATRSPDGTYYYRFVAEGHYGVVQRNGMIEVLRN